MTGAIEAQITKIGAPRPPSRRALAKQETRAKVLAAAKQLFSEQGYERATIRDIAARAGMSTGAVFANFSDKADLFREIIHQDAERLLGLMREAAGQSQPGEQAILKVCMTGYAFYKVQLPLARAALSVWWDEEHGPALRNLEPVVGIRDLFRELVSAALGAGERPREADLKLRGQMLFDVYLSNFSLLMFEDWSLDALQSRIREQIEALLAGCRRGA